MVRDVHAKTNPNTNPAIQPKQYQQQPFTGTSGGLSSYFQLKGSKTDNHQTTDGRKVV